LAGKNLQIKESAVKEKRIWVRLTRICNNGCLFCLDSDTQDGTIIPREQVEERIRAGREEGGQRLILSGGEATIHPNYIEFLQLGRQLGYQWLQTVTNGRMFAYRKFADRALAAGLNEATFSMHGHTAELHDTLVGVKGGFAQAFAGMRNLLGRTVVNVDVVMNRLNIPHLKEILEFYIALGINEFDLLHMVPFGRAWNEHRETLFYDPVEMMSHLKSGFQLRRRKGIIIWTNRLPAPYLEGSEDLIQDPHKIHDEVRGRTEMFEEWRDRGVEPMCRDDRCRFCAMESFCACLQETLDGLAKDSWNSVRGSTSGLARLGEIVDAGKANRAAGLQLVVDSESLTEDRVAETTIPLSVVEVESATTTAAAGLLELDTVKTLRLTSLADADPAPLTAFLERPGTDLKLPAEKGAAELFAELPATLLERVSLYHSTHDYLSESLEKDLSPDEIAGLRDETGVALEGYPPCLGGPVQPRTEPDADLTILGDDGKLDLVRFTDWFITRHYFTRSLRCTRCVHHESCRGLHINAVRNFGLGILKPLKG